MKPIVITPDDLGIEFDTLSVLTHKEARNICIIDAKQQVFGGAEDESNYVESNWPTVFILGNLWLKQIQLCSERSFYEVKRFVLDKGLIATIDSASTLSDMIIHDQTAATHPHYWMWYDFLQKGADSNSLRKILEILRFPKRYSPANATNVLRSGIEKFLTINRADQYVCNGIRDWKRSTINNYGRLLGDDIPTNMAEDNYFLPLVKEVVSEIIEHTPLSMSWWFRRYPELQSLDLNACRERLILIAQTDLLQDSHFHWTAGTNAETVTKNNTYFHKACVMQGLLPYYRDYTYSWGRENRFHEAIHVPCEIKAVPKSYSAPRLIGKEGELRNIIATGIREISTEYLSTLPVWSHICVDDQTPQRSRAFLGSVWEKLATIDLSSASDSISRYIGERLFPIFTYMPWLRARTCLIHGKVEECSIFLTSGNPLTFLCETIFFYAVAEAVRRYASLFDKRFKYAQPSTFGDDMIVDCRLFQMTVDVLTNFGCTVNVSKSFTAPSHYREACGEEYLDGLPMHGCKWPRTTFDWQQSKKWPDYIISFIDLQHRLYFHVSWEVNEMLVRTVLALEPKMTYSAAGDWDASDLWGPDYLVSVIRYKSFNWHTQESEGFTFHDSILELFLDGHGSSMRYYSEYQASGDLKEYFDVPKDGAMREAHLVPQAYWEWSKTDFHMEYDATLELAMYVDFLMNGPRYSSPLDKLLGVSEATSRKALIKLPKTRWVKVRK